MKNENFMFALVAVLFSSFLFTFYKYRQKRRLLQKDKVRDLSYFGRSSKNKTYKKA